MVVQSSYTGINLFQKKFIWPLTRDAKLSLRPKTGQGLKIVTLGKTFLTIYYASFLVLKSSDSESASAPAAEKWINLWTPCFAQAFAILSATSILMN